MSRPRVLVVGEALVDIVRQVDGTSAEHPGGSPANVALGLGRLGHRVDLLTRLGRDERGGTITRLLRASDVHVTDSSYTDAPTSTATATIDPAGVASYEFDIDWTLPAATASLAGAAGGDVDDVAVLHTGSIGAFLQPGGDTVLALVRDAADRVTVTYDPNARPRLMGDPEAARQGGADRRPGRRRQGQRRGPAVADARPHGRRGGRRLARPGPGRRRGDPRP
jgi:fructokinase